METPVRFYNDAYYIYYGHGQGKLVLFKGQGLKSCRDRVPAKKGSINIYKTSSNISRAKSKVIAYGLSNPWDYFITLTISPEKLDRTDLKAYQKKLGRYLENLRTNKGYEVKYLLVPELHSDGVSWHMHGLISGLPAHELTINEHGFLDWKGYQQRFGFCSVDKIKDPVAVVFYLTKYLTKQIGQALEVNRQSYYCSKCLCQGEVLYEGQYVDIFGLEGYENDFVKVVWGHDEKIIKGFIGKGLDGVPEFWYDVENAKGVG